MSDVQPRMPGVEARAGKFPGPSLIPALNAIQERVGWLPREELVALSRDVRRPLYEIEGLISFYPHFRTTPPERVSLRVCHDLSCWLRGAEVGLADGAMARVSSRRGTIVLATRVSHREARGNCFIPFHFREAAANLLTIDEIDPWGKIPEFKFCAVRIEAAPEAAGAGEAAPDAGQAMAQTGDR